MRTPGGWQPVRNNSMRLPDHRTVMEASYHGMLLGLPLLAQEESRAHVMIIGDSGSVVQPIHLQYTVHTHSVRVMRDAARDAVAAHGLELTLKWEKRDSNEEAEVAAKSAVMSKYGEVHVSSLTTKPRCEAWTGAKTRFAECYCCAVCRPQGSKQALTRTRVPRRGRVHTPPLPQR